MVDVIQGGAGTSTNMNANEVIANLALEQLGYEKSRYDVLHPLNHVNMSQSTNDVYPTALRLTLSKKMDGLLEEMDGLRNEMRAIRQAAENRDHGDDMREDLQRLSQSINQLGRHSGRSEADTLRMEFDELRSVLDGLAREDSVRRVEDRWSGLEQKISA